MADHWFDLLNKSLLGRAPRRVLLRGAVLAAIGRVPGEPGTEAAKRRKKKRQKKRRGKPKPCGVAACQANFTIPADVDFCQTKCGRCKKAGTEFCIHDADEEHPVKHATCCAQGDTCCGTECCGPSDTCCDTNRGRICVRDRVECCASDTLLGYCLPSETCCPGVGCVAGAESGCPNDDNCRDGSALCGGRCVNITSNESHCGGCGQVCAGDGMRCCDSTCLDARTDRNNCRFCGQQCPAVPGWECCSASCVDTLSSEAHCGACGTQCPSGQSCCDGVCADLQTDPAHCGICNDSCDPGHACCNTLCYNPATAACCHDFVPCPTDGNFVCCDGVPPSCRSVSVGCGP